MTQWLGCEILRNFHRIPDPVEHVHNVYIPYGRHLLTIGPMHPCDCTLDLINRSGQTFMSPRSRFLLGQARKTRQSAEYLGQLAIRLLHDLPASQDVFPDGPMIPDAQYHLRLGVVDSLLRALLDVFHHVAQHDVTFRDHKGRQHPLCVLIPTLLSNFTDDHQNGDIFILAVVTIDNYSVGACVYSHFMDLSAKRTWDAREYRNNKYFEGLQVVGFCATIQAVLLGIPLNRQVWGYPFFLLSLLADQCSSFSQVFKDSGILSRKVRTSHKE